MPGEHADHVLAEQGRPPQGGVAHAGRKRRRDQREGQLDVKGETNNPRSKPTHKRSASSWVTLYTLYSFSEGRLGKGGRDPAPRQRGRARCAMPQVADDNHSRIICADEMDVILVSDSDDNKLTHLIGGKVLSTALADSHCRTATALPVANNPQVL